MKPFEENYAKYYDLFNISKDYSKETEFLDLVFKKYSSGVKSILNLGCGTGLHDINLSSIGYEVVGLDLSSYMIKIANSRKNEKMEFVVGDMSNFQLNKKFDASICMFAAFGYLTENRQIERALKSIKEHLNPKGLFIFDVWNGLGVMRELPSSRTKEAEKENLKIIRISYPKLDSLNHVCKIRFDVKVLKNNEVIDSYEENHSMRFLFPQEIRKYLEDAGFEVLEICKTFELGTKIDENDWNMAIIARLR